MAHIEIEKPDPDTLVISVSRIEVANVTHDEYGHAGMHLAEHIAREIGRELYVEVEYK